MASPAIEKYPHEYEDMVLRPHCEQDEGVVVFHRYHDIPWISARAEGGGALVSLKRYPPEPEIRQGPNTLASRDMVSVSLVLDDIARAPFAYFRFFSIAAFLFFTLSLAFYSIFGIVLFNPVLALFGAFAALMTGLLVEASLLRHRKSLGMGQRGIRA